jgi:hypothetical protein
MDKRIAGETMILREYIPSLNRLKEHMKGEMLMLGDQEYTVEYKFPCPVKTMDIQGKADYIHDLTKPFKIGFDTVFNLGTLEHIWDVHSAFTNTAKIVNLGGNYIGHHPVAGWEGHGIHVTDWKYIQKFFLMNGFSEVLSFFTTKEGMACEAPSRNCGRSIIYWCVFKKNEFKKIDKPIDLCK